MMPFRLRESLFLVLALVAGACSDRSAPAVGGGPDTSLARVKEAGVLLWGADVVGGVPYVYEDPKHPGEYIGFEMEIARGLAKHLGVKLKLVVKALVTPFCSPWCEFTIFSMWCDSG